MDIKELRAKQVQLSEDIREMITDFEKETGVTITRLELERIKTTMVGSRQDDYLLNVDVRIEI